MIEVILAHSILPNGENTKIGPIRECSVSAKQLEYFLESRKTNFVSTTSLYSTSGGTLLTFDDGYRDNLTEALPLIERFEARTIIFVTVGFVGGRIYPYELELASVIEDHDTVFTPSGLQSVDVRTKETGNRLYQRLRLPLKTASYEDRNSFLNLLASVNSYEREQYQNEYFLSWKDVAELDQHPLITIGAHTVTHPVLTRRWPWVAYREMKQSKREIEEVIDRPVRHFSYPYGRNNALVRTLARWAGFQWAFTTERRRVESLEECGAMSIPRIDIQHLI